MGNTLGSLYTCPRELLRRRRWKLGVMVRNFFFNGQILRIFGSPTYCIMKPSERCNTQIKKFKLYVNKNVGWDCVVGTVTHCELDSPGIKSWWA